MLIPEKTVSEVNEKLRLASDGQLYDWLVVQLYEAFSEAQRGKRNTVNEQRFEEDRDIKLAELAHDIISKRYVPSRSVAFIITNPTPREIFAAPFRDRIVHHFLIQHVGDFWDKRLSPRSFSCREGKGTLYGIRHLERDIQRVTNSWREPAWVMKLDLQGYFMSLPRKYLFERVCFGLSMQFPNRGPLHDMFRFLWHQIIFDNPLDGVRLKGDRLEWGILPPSKSMFNSAIGRGIVIGNLTSQWVSNMALDPLDRYVRIELGHKCYGRYVDDMYFVARTREELLVLRDKVVEFTEAMGLVVHPKKFYLQPVTRGVAFLGEVIYPGYSVVGQRMSKNMRLLAQSIHQQGLTQKNIVSMRAYRGMSSHMRHKVLLNKVFGREILNATAWRYYSSQPRRHEFRFNAGASQNL